MSNKCPDKLEPQYLTSVLKNVPVELMWHLREYHSKPSHFEIKWKARQPVEGKKFGFGGNLKWEDARSGDMYVRDRSLEQKYHHLQDTNNFLRLKCDNIEDANKRIGDSYIELKKEHDDLNDVHKSLSKEYNAIMSDHCGYDKDYAIDKSANGADYEAVTKGIKGLINLLRR